MKTKYIFLLSLSIGVALGSCDDDLDKASQPVARATVEEPTVEVNQSMVLHYQGTGDRVSVYPGDEGHDYELRDQGNSGLVVNKGIFTYSYSTPGTYKVVCVANSVGDGGETLLSDTCSLVVTVIDDITAIDRISAPQVLYDEVFAEAVNSTDWVLKLPRKVKYKTSTPSVSLSQKLKFYISSLTTTISIDGAAVSTSKKYDLTKSHDITTLSNAGTSRAYRLYTLSYGEFKSFAVGGVTGKIERTEYDYSVQYINVKVAQGTDLTQMVPKFTLYGDNEKVYLNGVEYATGTVTDFTEPVEFTFVSTCADKPELTATSKCTVTVTYK